MRVPIAFLLLLCPAFAQAPGKRTVAGVLLDHGRAIGGVDKVKALRSTGNANLGREAYASALAWYRDGYSLRRMMQGPFEYIGPQGVFFAQREAFFRFRRSDPNTRLAWHTYKTLANPFPLLEYVRDPAAQRGLEIAFAKGLWWLRAPADANGLHTVYSVHPKTHVLHGVRFQKGERVVGAIVYGDYRMVDGVALPHRIEARYILRVENEEKEALTERAVYRVEQIARWTVNPDMKGIAFDVPGLGKGGAQGFRRIELATGMEPHEIAVADLDGDGKNDIAVACLNGVAVHFGGALKERVFVPLADGQMRGLVATDLDVDGRPELLTMSRTHPPSTFFTVSFDAQRKPAKGKFAGAPKFGWALAARDLDRDGIDDFVATSSGAKGGRRLHTKFGNGCGGFRVVGNAWPLANQLNPLPRGYGVAIGRIDKDIFDDILVADGTHLRAFMGKVNLAFLPLPGRIIAGPRPVDVCMVDLDGDGDNDIVVANDHPVNDVRGDLAVLLNTGDSLKAVAKVEAGRRVATVRAGHFNADKHFDVAATSFTTGEVTLLYGDGKGGLKDPERLLSGRGAHRLAVTDFDGDGRTDILCANRLDDTVVLFLNERELAAHVEAARPRAVACKKTEAVKFKLKGLSSEYEFVAEFRLPAAIPDPSGIAWLGGDDAHRQLVVVSDKKAALFRLVLDVAGRRLLAGPPVPLIGQKQRRLDLEGLAFDHESGNLFLACEADSTILRANVFGQVVGEFKTGIEFGDNDGLEGLAVRRRRDGTPLLYAFRERVGMTLRQPKVSVFGMEEDPFALVPRGEPRRLPFATPDQTGAAVWGQRMWVLARFIRSVAEVDFDGDGFSKNHRKAEYGELIKLLGHAGLPMGEGLAVDRWGDLYIVLDNNGKPTGNAGINHGPEGRLIWLRRTEPLPLRPQPREVVVKQIFIPWQGARGNPKVQRTRKEAAALARECLERLRAGVAFDKIQKEVHFKGHSPELMHIAAPPSKRRAGVFMRGDLPKALGDLAFSLDVGEFDVCEWHRKDSPDGYHVILRIK